MSGSRTELYEDHCYRRAHSCLIKEVGPYDQKGPDVEGRILILLLVICTSF